MLALVLCGVIAASGYMLLGLAFKPAVPPTDDAGAPVEEPSLGTAIGTAGRQVKEIVATGIAMAERRLSPSPAAVEPAVPVSPRRTSSPAAPVRRTASAAEAVEAGPSPSWTVSVQDVTASWLAARGEIHDVESPSGLDAAESSTAVHDQALGPLYSALDGDVEPATLVRPQLPSEVRNLVLPEGEVGTLELIVNERGSVDQVRLVSATSRLNEKMLIAAAKAWLFDPARRDGLPVRYVVRIQITE